MVADQKQKQHPGKKGKTGTTKTAKSTAIKKPKSAGLVRRYPKSISRIETKKHCAWYVRIYYEGAYVRKTFSDTVYGGKENAFREALQWRDEMEKRMGKPRTERSVRKKTVVDDRVVGIHRRHLRDVKRGRIYFRDVYEVTWCPEPGKVARTTVSVTKHGEEEAFRMARAIRREKEREHFGGTIS